MKWIFSLILCLSTIFASENVTVSILPQKYFVEKIAGDTLKVNVMVLPGSSPATYEPKPSQMSNLEKSDLYFAIGVPFEKSWLPKFHQQFPKLPIIETQKGIKKIAMSEHHHHEENEHHEHEEESHEHHHHGILDPHIWLDPILVKTQAKNIANALIEKYPKHKDLYKKNLNIFLSELDTINSTIKSKLEKAKYKKFMVYHPAWGYFAKRYGLTQEAVELEGKEPKSGQLQELINEAKEDDIHVVFVQPQFSKKSAQLIADAINGKVVSLNPLEENWEEGLMKTTEVLLSHLK